MNLCESASLATHANAFPILYKELVSVDLS